MLRRHVLLTLAQTLRRFQAKTQAQRSTQSQLHEVYELLKQLKLERCCESIVKPNSLTGGQYKQVLIEPALKEQLCALQLNAFGINTQMEASAILAEHLGCYDAADVIRSCETPPHSCQTATNAQ